MLSMANKIYDQSEVEIRLHQNRLHNLKKVALVTILYNLLYISIKIVLFLLKFLSDLGLVENFFLLISSFTALAVVLFIQKGGPLPGWMLGLYFVVMSLTSITYSLETLKYNTQNVAWYLSMVFLPYAYYLPWNKAALWILPNYVGFLAAIHWYFYHHPNFFHQISYVMGGAFFVPVGLFVSHHLYTVQRRQVEELVVNRQNLQFKNQVLSVLGHDLRNSLGSSYQLVNWLVRRWDQFTKDEIKSDLEQLGHNLERSYELLEGLVVWAKSRGQNPAVELKDFLPRDILEKVRSLWSDLLIQKAISLEIDIKGDSLRWDPMLYEIVVRNLVHNAIKNSPPRTRIHIHVERFNGNWVTEIEDEGPGFPPEVLNLQEHTESSQPGSGLGLRLIRELLEPTGVHLELENRSSGGAVARLVYGPPHSRAS